MKYSYEPHFSIETLNRSLSLEVRTIILLLQEIFQSPIIFTVPLTKPTWLPHTDHHCVMGLQDHPETRTL